MPHQAVGSLILAHAFASTAVFGQSGLSGLPLSFRPLVVTGDTAPGTNGAIFGNFFASEPAINNAGQVAFKAVLEHGGPVDASNDEGVWMTDPTGALRLVAREGDVAPGTSGARFDFLDPTFILNNVGEVALQNTLRQVPKIIDEFNDSGVWIGDSSGNLTLIAREGDLAPGTGGGTFDEVGAFASGGFIRLNDLGQIALANGLQVGGGAVAGSTNSGLWRLSANGDDLILAREGDPVPGLSGEFFDDTDAANRTVRISNTGGTVFAAEFRDSNGPSEDGLFATDATGAIRAVAFEDQ